MTHDLAIRGGVVVTPRGRRQADVYITDGRIAEITDADQPAREEVDATGLHVIPGLIDSHVHFMDPGETSREDFITGSSAAAVGGVTTVVEHTHAAPVLTPDDLCEKVEHLRHRSLVDFGLAAHIWPENKQRLPELWRAGIAYFKAFTCNSHGVPALSNAVLLGTMGTALELGAPILVHCEDEAITANDGETLRAAGRRHGDVICAWRSREAELVAANTVALMAQLSGARVILAHASHAPTVDLAEHYRSRGADLWVETCPQYLYLQEAEVLALGAFRKFTPPARARSPWEAEELWRKVAFGHAIHISSDHAPATRAHKERGVWDAPFGLPGVETTLSLLLAGVAHGYVSLERVVELVCEQPARLYGFFPRKGTLRPGADADLVLVDLAATRRLTHAQVVSKAGWTPYDGQTVHGFPIQTYVRGQLVAEKGHPVGQPGWGRFTAGKGKVGS